MSSDTAALADAIEEELPFEPDSVTDADSEVFVNVKSRGANPLTGMDDVCAIAYDHGFVPLGIVEGGAARFKPRDNDETRV